MVVREHKQLTALKITGERRESIIKAYQEQAKKRLFPDKKSAIYLIDQFNEVSGGEVMTQRAYGSCVDCRLYILTFWKGIVSAWERTK